MAAGSVENASILSLTSASKFETRCLIACSWARFARSTFKPRVFFFFPAREGVGRERPEKKHHDKRTSKATTNA